MCSEMRTSNKSLYICVIFSVSVACLTQNITTEEVNVTEKATPFSVQSDVAIECETPNNGPGLCIDIRQCSILMKQLANKKAKDFLLASVCRPPSASNFYPKVCCGQDDNYVVLPKSCGHQELAPGTRVVGGKETVLGQYPWMVLLLHKNKKDETIMGCTGFLIHPKYVITAAHCTHYEYIGKRGPIVSILLGEHDMRTSEDCSGNICANNTQTRKINKVIIHPDYEFDNSGRYNDIAIIKLNSKARVTDYVKPICLLNDETDTPVSYFVSGWGKTENASHSKVKLHVEIPKFNKTKCEEIFSNYEIYLRDTQICAGGQEMADSCTGDSGGPLMMQKGSRWYAAGVVSFGVGCGLKGMPGVYTNMAKFVPWITSQIAQEQNTDI